MEKAVLTEADLESMRKRFRIPLGVTLRIGSAEEKPSRPKPGEVCLYPIAFDNGLRLPFHPFIGTLLSHFGLVPTQLGPSAWRHIVGSIILWRLCSADKDHITLDEFNYCYKFRHYMSHWYLNPRESRVLVLGSPKQSALYWSKSFFFAGGTWQCGPGEGELRSAPPVPTEWGFVDKDKMEEPILSDFYIARVNRALAFDSNRRDCTNLITTENINKYLLNNVPNLPSPSFANASFSLDQKIFPESWKSRKRRVSGRTVDCPPTTKLCSDAKRKIAKMSESSSTQTDSARPKLGGFPKLLAVDSSSSEGSLEIVDKGKKRAAHLPCENNTERANQLLTADEIKQIEDLGSKEALLKSISYSAKGVAMMVAVCGQLGKESKLISNHKETLSELHKTKKAYVDQLAATYMLSKDLEALKNRLAKTEKLVKDRDETIHAKDKELRAREEQMRAKDDQIRTLNEAVRKFTESVKHENLTAQCYFKASEAFGYQSSSFPLMNDWSPLEPISGCDQKPF